MKQSRREFLKFCWQVLSVYFLFNILGETKSLKKQKKNKYKIDTKKCIVCGNCSEKCVRKDIPAIQAINDEFRCGFCVRCSAYFLEPDGNLEDKKNRVCPYNAIIRKQIEDFKYQYTIDKEKCRGCGECVKRCKLYGKNSLKLYVNPELCLGCNFCSAQKVCSNNAFIPVLTL